MDADHAVGINRLPEDQREEIRKRAKEIQREGQARQPWVPGDGNGDPSSPENWRECGIGHPFVQFDPNDPFDETGHKGFPTCVYLQDLALAYLLQQKVSVKNLSGAFPGDVNEDGSIDTALGQQRRNRGLAARTSTGRIYDLHMTRGDGSTVLYALKGASANEETESSSSQSDSSMSSHNTSIELAGIADIHVDRIDDRSSSSSATDTSSAESNSISGDQPREPSARGEISTNISSPVANTSMAHSTGDDVAESCQATQRYWSFFRSRKLETFPRVKIALMGLGTTLLLQYLVLCISLVVCLIPYVESQSICSSTHQNPICAIPGTSWMIGFCSFEGTVGMEAAVEIPGQFVKAGKEGEAALALPQVFEHLHTNLTFFEPLIAHSDFSCKAQLTNEISLFLTEGRNASDELQLFTLELIELIDEIFYETKGISDDLLTLTWQWESYHWFETYIPLLAKLYGRFVASPDDLMEKHRHIWLQYLDTLSKRLTNLGAKSKKIGILLLKLQDDLKEIHWLTSKEVKLIQQRLRSESAKYKIFRSFIDIADYESQLIFLENFDHIREAAYVVLVNVHKSLNGIDQNIRHTRDQLTNPHVRTKLSLGRQIERINNAVMDLDDARQSIKKERGNLVAQEALDAAAALRVSKGHWAMRIHEPEMLPPDYEGQWENATQIPPT